MSDSDARFSLVAGEGDGAILGMAAGDAAGGAWELGYSAITEQATVIAYHLIEHGAIVPEELVASLLEMDGSDGEEPVYRAESAQFRSWLDRAKSGRPAPGPEPSLDGVWRAIPIGVALRRDPGALRRDALAIGSLFHSDPHSILSTVVGAAAVAASCFGQTGRDMLAGVIELLEPADGLPMPAAEVTAELRRLQDLIREPEEGSVQEPGDSPWSLVKTGLLLSSTVVDRAHLPVERAAKTGGSPLAAMVGGIVGARVGIRAWPWAFANDTWFAEIGRRLVRGPSQTDDLPIPYAVEHHLIAGERQGLY